MACEFICDGCGKRVPAVKQSHNWHWGKPSKWFQRVDDDGIQDACSRECIEKIAKASGKTRLVLPI